LVNVAAVAIVLAAGAGAVGVVVYGTDAEDEPIAPLAESTPEEDDAPAKTPEDVHNGTSRDADDAPPVDVGSGHEGEATRVTEADMNGALDGARDAILRCGLSRDTTVEITFEIGAGGKAGNFVPASPHTHSGEGACIARVLAELTFPSPAVAPLSLTRSWDLKALKKPKPGKTKTKKKKKAGDTYVAPTR
jgi:hypothetical protein